MADGKEWTTNNLNMNVRGSYCYDNSEMNCRRYGRLYTSEAARQACKALGNRWRLPTDEDWRLLAQSYGNGAAAYKALIVGGRSGFSAVLGGNRSDDGHFERLRAHGFYWTTSENDTTTAVFYNFGLGSRSLYRQPEGSKRMAISVRCVRD